MALGPFRRWSLLCVGPIQITLFVSWISCTWLAAPWQSWLSPEWQPPSTTWVWQKKDLQWIEKPNQAIPVVSTVNPLSPIGSVFVAVAKKGWIITRPNALGMLDQVMDHWKSQEPLGVLCYLASGESNMGERKIFPRVNHRIIWLAMGQLQISSKVLTPVVILRNSAAM